MAVPVFSPLSDSTYSTPWTALLNSLNQFFLADSTMNTNEVSVFLRNFLIWKKKLIIGAIFLQNDSDPGSGSKFFIQNRDHFWLDDHVKDFCSSGSFERKFLKQQRAYYRAWCFVIKFSLCTSFWCILCALLSFKKK